MTQRSRRRVAAHARWLERPLVRLLCLAFVSIVAGCAATSAERAEDRAATEETLERILSEPLDEAEYGKPRRCISQYAYRDFEPLGERFVVFEGPGNRLWLNELRGRCPGLDRASTLAFRNRGFQLCELDQFKVTDVFAWERYQRWPWRWMDGIPCTLGKFQPISTEQLEALRATLR